MRSDIPYARAGQTVGLLGGSFDPAHEGHAHITREALKHFGLDRVWWLVSPGNPLKPEGPAPMEQRMKRARKVIDDPRVTVSDIEAKLGTRYTAATLEGLRALYPFVHFVWLMGADNLAGFHHWDRWEQIMSTVPIGILARPGERISARTSVAAGRFEKFRLPPSQARTLARSQAPAWCFLNVPMRAVSSSAIRAAGDWPKGSPSE